MEDIYYWWNLQIMYGYEVNGRCTSPCHLWLTGCEGEMGSQLKRLLGFDKWIIGKELTIYWSITRAKGKSSISHSRCRNCSGGTWSEENIYWLVD